MAKLVLETQMRGAHGQEGALKVAVTEEGHVLFHDTARYIYGICTKSDRKEEIILEDEDINEVEATSTVRHCYIEHYHYSYNADAGNLGSGK